MHITVVVLFLLCATSVAGAAINLTRNRWDCYVDPNPGASTAAGRLT